VYEALHRAGVPTAAVLPLTAAAYVVTNYGLVVPGVAVRIGRPLRAVWSDLRSGAVNDLMFAVLGLLLGRLYLLAGSVSLLAIIGPVIVARTALLSVARFRDAYHRLEVLYTFTKDLEDHRGMPDAVPAMVDQLRKHLGVHIGEVTLLTGDGWQCTALHGVGADVVHREGSGVPLEVRTAEEGGLLVSTVAPDQPIRLELADRAIPDAIIVPLRSDTRLLGAVVVGEGVDGRTLTDDDLRLLETLAKHAAVSLENTRLVDQLLYDSRHDELTGLPNRPRFIELLTELERPGAILLIDLDRFKEVNDTLGHDQGDHLLRDVSARIIEEFGHKGIVARLGGDEFGILLPHTSSGDAAQAAVTLLAILEQPFYMDGLALELTGSVGVAVATRGTKEQSAVKLLQHADVAMYAAKEAHSGWEMYAPERDHYSPKRLAMAGELRRAIEEGELEVHYQPKADLRTGTVCGLEALVRWRNQYGLISPDQFVPVAEHAGLIRPLTLFVLSQAAQQHQELRLLGFDLGIAVNLSVRSLVDVNLPDQVADVLAAHGMDPSALTLEITEGSVMADPGRTIGILGRLANLGTTISIDDFGTGYSSLAYLKRLPASEVKIDRSFVKGMLNSESDAAIVRSTVDLARNLGLRAVAEGVEDGHTWSELARLECDQAQGYFISPAVPAPDLRRWLERTEKVVDPLL
jgi:diguanylate cyclase (GGDEF)-like protein